MSELRTHSLRHNTWGGDNPNIEMFADGSTSINSLQNTEKNLIINGAMTVAQRSTEETSVTGNGYRTCDQFRISANIGTWTIQQSTESPVGFGNSLRLLCTTAETSPGATDTLLMSQRIEAQNLQQLFDTGTTTRRMTLSFWVRSSRTGNASVNLIQTDNANRLFSASYNIASANTWEHKVIPIPSDTAAAFDNDNGEGLRIQWWLNSGSDFTSGSHSAGWIAIANANRNSTNLGLGAAINDDFHLTGVQLTATDGDIGFQHESYGDTLAKCQRYFYRITQPTTGSITTMPFVMHQTSGGNARGTFTPVVPFRAAPTLTHGGVIGNFQFMGNGTSFVLTSMSAAASTENVVGITCAYGGSIDNAEMGGIRFGADGEFIHLSAEL